MSVNHAELQPEIDDVLQVEDPAGADPEVKVRVQGHVRVQELPRKAGATFTKDDVPTAPGVQILRADPRRSKATLTSPAAIRVAFTAGTASEPSRTAWWPANVPFELTVASDVWVMADTGTADISVITEYWATGEGPR